MGKLFDELCDSAQESDLYWHGVDIKRVDINRAKREGTEGKKIPLPHPWKKKQDDVAEKDIQKAILLELKKLGVTHWRVSLGNKTVRNSSGGAVAASNELKGFPDIMCIVDGILIGIEVKCPGGSFSDFQISKADSIMRAGGIYFCGISPHAAFFVSQLKGIDYDKKIESFKTIARKQNFFCAIL